MEEKRHCTYSVLYQILFTSLLFNLISFLSLKSLHRKQCFNDRRRKGEKGAFCLDFFVAYVCHWWSRVGECQCLSAQWGGTSPSNLSYLGGSWEGGHGQGWREANTESWSGEQLREGGCSWPISVPCLFVLTLFSPIQEQSTGADTECDLTGLDALCLQEDLKLSRLICALISCWSCCFQWSALPAPVFSGLYSCSVWVFLHCWRCFPHFFSVYLGPGMLEHKISLCCFFLSSVCHDQLVFWEHLWLSVMLMNRSDHC